MSSSSTPIDNIDNSSTTASAKASATTTMLEEAAANTEEELIDDEGIRSILDGLDSSGRNASGRNASSSNASSYQAFLRYRENNKPDGDSSDEEGERNVEHNKDPTEIANIDVASDTATDETTDADEEYNAYSALGDADDYGDFQGFEIDDNNEVGFGGGKSEFGAGVFDNDEEDEAATEEAVEEAVEEEQISTTPEPPFVSIPPLSQAKIEKIKLAMSKFTLTMKPGLGTSALLEMVDSKRMRVGDEGIKKDDELEREEKDEKDEEKQL